MTVSCFHLMIFMTTYYLYKNSASFTMENPDYDHYRSHRCRDSLSIQAEAVTWLKVSAVVIRRKGNKLLCSICKAAAFVLWTLALVRALRNQWKDLGWFGWNLALDLALDLLMSEQVSVFQSQELNQAWQDVPGLNNATGDVPKACNAMFSFIFECTLVMNYFILSLSRCVPLNRPKGIKRMLWHFFKSWNRCMKLNYHQRPWVHLRCLFPLWVVGGF